MELNDGQMRAYIDFLDENSQSIKTLCSELQELIAIAKQCMDQENGPRAAASLSNNIETINQSVPANDDAVKTLVLTLKKINDARKVF